MIIHVRPPGIYSWKILSYMRPQICTGRNSIKCVVAVYVEVEIVSYVRPFRNIQADTISYCEAPRYLQAETISYVRPPGIYRPRQYHM